MATLRAPSSIIEKLSSNAKSVDSGGSVGSSAKTSVLPSSVSSSSSSNSSSPILASSISAAPASSSSVPAFPAAASSISYTPALASSISYTPTVSSSISTSPIASSISSSSSRNSLTSQNVSQNALSSSASSYNSNYYDPNKDYSLAIVQAQQNGASAEYIAQLQRERQNKINAQYNGVDPYQGSNPLVSQTAQSSITSQLPQTSQTHPNLFGNIVATTANGTVGITADGNYVFPDGTVFGASVSGSGGQPAYGTVDIGKAKSDSTLTNGYHWSTDSMPNMARRTDLAGQAVTSGGFTVFYDENGYVKKALKGNIDYTPVLDENAKNGSYSSQGAWTDQEMMTSADFQAVQNIRARLTAGQLTGEQANQAANAIREKYGYVIDQQGYVTNLAVKAAVDARRAAWGLGDMPTQQQIDLLLNYLPEDNRTLEQLNTYLEDSFLTQWEQQQAASQTPSVLPVTIKQPVNNTPNYNYSGLPGFSYPSFESVSFGNPVTPTNLLNQPVTPENILTGLITPGNAYTNTITPQYLLENLPAVENASTSPVAPQTVFSGTIIPRQVLSGTISPAAAPSMDYSQYLQNLYAAAPNISQTSQNAQSTQNLFASSPVPVNSVLHTVIPDTVSYTLPNTAAAASNTIPVTVPTTARNTAGIANYTAPVNNTVQNSDSSGNMPVNYFDQSAFNSASQYLREIYQQQIAAEQAALQAAYTQNVLQYQKQAEAITEQYRDQQNQTAAQHDLAQQNMNEYGVAQGLNTGAAGQLALSQNIALQSNLAQLRTAESQDQTQNALAQARLSAEFTNAMQQAAANGNVQLAQSLYNEYVRQQNLSWEKEKATQEQSNWQQEFDYGKQKDKQTQDNWLAQFQYNQQQDQQAQNNWLAQFQYNQQQEQQAQNNWLAQFQYNQLQDQQTQNNWLAQFQHNRLQDQQAQNNWLAQFQYNQQQDQQAQNNWLTQFDYNQRKDQQTQNNWLAQFQYNWQQDQQAQNNWLAQFQFDQQQAQQDYQNWLAQFQFNQLKARQDQSNWQTQFQYNQQQDQQTQNNWLAQFNSDQLQAQQNYQNWLAQFQYNQQKDQQTQNNWLAQFQFNQQNTQQDYQNWLAQFAFNQLKAQQDQSNWQTQFAYQQQLDAYNRAYQQQLDAWEQQYKQNQLALQQQKLYI